MIKQREGRSRSERSAAEIEAGLQEELATLSDEEREALEVALQELTGKKPQQDGFTLLQAISKVEYKHPPVDLETFVRDPFFLGNTCDNLYPKLLDDLAELFSGGYHEAIFTGSIGWGKCHRDTSLVTDVVSGERKSIKDFVGATPLVPSLKGNEIGTATAAKVWPSGQKECAKLTLASGQWLEASWDHPVLTRDGYKKLEELSPDDLVACARYAPAPQNPLTISDAEVQTLACLLADGAMAQGNRQYVKGDPALVAQFEAAVAQLPEFEGFGPKVFQRGAWYVRPHGLAEWARRWGIDCKSKDKRVPPKLFGLSDGQLALFLRWLYTDGNVYVGTPRKIELALASEGMIDDVQELLRRFGVVARKTFAPKKAVKDGDYCDAWRLQIADAPSQIRFLSSVGFIPGKEAACEFLKAQAAAVRSNPNWDIVPVTRRELKDFREEVGPVSNEEWNKYGLLAETSYMGREKFQRLCERFGYAGKHSRFNTDALVWERVVSVEGIGVHDVYDLTVPETGNVVANGIVVHNTFAASIGVCRVLYELSCLKDPHTSFGLAKDSNISLVNLSVNEILATKVVFENIATKIRASPYFQENFPFEVTKKELRFPGHIWVASRASTDTSVLGLNCIGGIVDETNFMAKVAAKDERLGGYDHAEILYNAIKRRMKSRFQRRGKLPGMLFVVSSKKTLDDFTARRVNEAKDDGTVFVRDYALWDVKPDGQYGTARFHVMVGNDQAPSKILEPAEVESTRANLPEGAVVVEVPEDFRLDFERDLEGAIRDIAGVATVAVSPFIQRREKIEEAIDHSREHPFTSESYDPSKPAQFLWDRMVGPTRERNYGVDSQRVRPLLNPTAIRHVHIDPSLRGDCTGFCMAHVGGWKDVVRRSPDGQQYIERAPVYVLDFVLRIIPPIGEEIILGDVRRFVYDLSAHGYSISCVSMDSWQSADAIQQLNQKGYNAMMLSVDTSVDPYENLKTALYENRVFYYEYQPLLNELKRLEDNRIKRKRKIDHPKRGSKDVADAVAGCLYTLSKQQISAPLPIMSSSPMAQATWLPEAAQAYMAGNARAAASSALDTFGQLPPFLVGYGNDWSGGWDPK